MDFIDNLPPPPQFLCPNIRSSCKLESQRIQLGARVFIIDNTCYFSDADEAKKSSLHHLTLATSSDNKVSKPNDLYCAACSNNTIGKTDYYCNKCCTSFHKECVESPSVLISPFHPKYPLQLVQWYIKDARCHFCAIRVERLVYYSPDCDLILDPVCANKWEVPTINNLKRHKHTLHYFPRKASVTCDACGSDDNKICLYICHQCNFVIHKTCVGLPYVIQISRHCHRLSFTYSFSSGNWSCGVCHLKMDRHNGGYSCSKACAYAVHSKCATLDYVWDGIELEDQPETVDDNLKSCEEIGDGNIRHFSHPHHIMRFEEYIDKVYHVNKHCKACLLPLYDGNICTCMQCDFLLHETCANLPRLKHCMVQAQQFILQPGNSASYFFCGSCHRYSSGFRYACCEGDTTLDLRCASLSEPVHHQSHPHPLFLTCTSKSWESCSICGEPSYRILNCVECVFALCFCCATLPHKVKHEDDDHLLNLCYEKDASCSCWCQVCEEKIDPERGYYSCSECGFTLHIQCNLGNDPYLKPGKIITIFEIKIDIIPNNRLVRPICIHCGRRCPYKIAFRKDEQIFLFVLRDS